MIQSLIGQDSIWITVAIKLALIATVFLPFVSVLAMFAIWWERKVAGHIQGRFGPMHVGGWHGWAQSIADGVKLILKEDLIPKGADQFMFRLAPYLAFAPVFAALLALPFGPQFVFENGLNIGVLYLLAVLSVEVMGTILAGWGSNSKWSIYGAMREACQMVSYEIPLGITIICGVVVAGTLHLTELSYLQGGGLHDWFIYHNPFLFLAFFVYFVASLASNKRAPFDLPESESELVAGFHTEYSGIRWSLFFFAEYTGMFIVGAIQVVLFLGAWNSPLGPYDPIYAVLGYDPIAAGQAYFSGAVNAATSIEDKAAALGLAGPVQLILLNVYCAAIFCTKAMSIIFVQIWLRWTLPRIRIDQVLYACVKVLLPMSLVLLVGNALWVWLVTNPQPIALTTPAGTTVNNYNVIHLVEHGNTIQMITQIVLTAIGILAFIYVLGIVAHAFLTRAKHPPQTFFPDTMPVGQQHFNPGSPAAEPEDAGPEPAPAA
jgi:NADH-quinone oxidoreductase subunit H